MVPPVRLNEAGGMIWSTTEVGAILAVDDV